MNLKILNSKEKKAILKQLEEQYGKFETDLVFLMNTKNNIYLSNKDFANIDLEKLRINSMGMYFGEQMRDYVRLSIEGSQLVGKTAKKNVVEVTEEEAKRLMNGQDLEKECDVFGFVIVKCKNDFLGSGMYKEGKILNFVPKSRRIAI